VVVVKPVAEDQGLGKTVDVKRRHDLAHTIAMCDAAGEAPRPTTAR
jgi:hypothetical protein